MKKAKILPSAVFPSAGAGLFGSGAVVRSESEPVLLRPGAVPGPPETAGSGSSPLLKVTAGPPSWRETARTGVQRISDIALCFSLESMIRSYGILPICRSGSRFAQRSAADGRRRNSRASSVLRPAMTAGLSDRAVSLIGAGSSAPPRQAPNSRHILIGPALSVSATEYHSSAPENAHWTSSGAIQRFFQALPSGGTHPDSDFRHTGHCRFHPVLRRRSALFPVRGFSLAFRILPASAPGV